MVYTTGHKTYKIEAYFRTGVIVNGIWEYLRVKNRTGESITWCGNRYFLDGVTLFGRSVMSGYVKNDILVFL